MLNDFQFMHGTTLIAIIAFTIYIIIYRRSLKKLSILDPILEKCQKKHEFFELEVDSLKKKIRNKIITEIAAKEMFLDGGILSIFKGIYTYNTDSSVKEMEDIRYIFGTAVYGLPIYKEFGFFPTVFLIIGFFISNYNLSSILMIIISGIYIVYGIYQAKKREQFIYHKDSSVYLRTILIENGGYNRTSFYFSDKEPVLVKVLPYVRDGKSMIENNFDNEVYDLSM